MKIKFLTILLLLASCTMAPRYEKPKANLPFVDSQDSSKEKITRISWDKFFVSQDLQRIINLALENNRDLRIANLNIESAQAAHGVARADLLPTINAVGSETRQGVPGTFAAFTPKKLVKANLSLSTYEIDFFGRLQSLKKSAYEQFLATQQARNVMKITVISETVNAYAQLLLDRQILKIAEKNLKAQEDKYHFSELRYQNGIDSKSTLLLAQTVHAGAVADYETYKKLVQQDQNALMVLTGIFDEKSLPQDASLDDIKINEDLLEFVPSEVLLSRPDIMQAEHILKSANADIGAARAAFFPTISLTGSYGYSSRDYGSLFNSRLWTFTPQISLPIFSGGRNFANLKIADVQKKVEVAQYEKAIQTAFREVLDQLAERESVSNQLKAYEDILAARGTTYDLLNKRYAEGISNNVDVLDALILLTNAEQNRASMKKQYIMNLVMLYKVFGGGNEVVEEKK